MTINKIPINFEMEFEKITDNKHECLVLLNDNSSQNCLSCRSKNTLQHSSRFGYLMVRVLLCTPRSPFNYLLICVCATLIVYRTPPAPVRSIAAFFPSP